MNPTQSSIDPKEPRATPSNLEIFQTPWKNKFIGTRQKLYLVHDKTNHTVRAQIVTQNVFKRFTYFLGKKLKADKSASSSTKKFNVVEEKEFTGAAEARFKEKKEDILTLLEQHHSAKALLAKLEEELGSCRNNGKETRSFGDGQLLDLDFDVTETGLEANTRRHRTIEELRAEITRLLAKIEEQEKSDDLQSYERTKSSIRRIKEGVASTFLQINKLEQDVDDREIPSAELEEAFNEIKSSQMRWNQDIAEIRQTSLEEMELKKEIAFFCLQEKFLPRELQSKQQELMQEWERYCTNQSATRTETQEHGKKIYQILNSICKAYKQSLNETIEANLESLEQRLNSGSPDFSGEMTQQMLIGKQALVMRKKTWNALIEAREQLGNDLHKVADWQQRILKEQTIDESLIRTLTIEQKEGYLERIYSSLRSPLKNVLATSFFNFYPQSRQLTEKELFDEGSLFYANRTLEKIHGSIAALLDSFSTPTDNQASFIESHHSLLENPNLTQAMLGEFIDQFILFYQKAARDDGLPDEAIETACENLNLKRALLAIILEGQQQYSHAFAERIKKEYPKAFSESAHPFILEQAQNTAQEILQITAPSSNLKTLSTDWKQSQKALVPPIELLKHLESLESLYREYGEIAKNREKEIEKLSGEEKEKGETALAELSQSIESFEFLKDAPINKSSINLYKSRFLNADSGFDLLFNAEGKKRSLIMLLHKELDAFVPILDGYESQLSEVENFYSIELTDLRKQLRQKRENIQKWKKKGILPTSYLNYAPKFALPSFLYYTSALLPSKEIDVHGLNFAELGLYIESIKKEILIQKNELSYSYISEVSQSLKEFQDLSKELVLHIKSLTSAVQPKKNAFDEQNDQFQVPKGLSTTELPKLQFYNATQASNRQKKLEADQKASIKASPTLKSIWRRLKGDTQSLQTIFEQSKKLTTLSLIVQIEKLKDNPAQQKLAKQAFIETLTTKMSSHTKTITAEAKSFESFPQLFSETNRLIGATKEQLLQRLKRVPKALQSHAQLWEPIKTNKTKLEPFSTPQDIPLESLSASELQSYAEEIDLTIKTGNDHIKLIRETYKKADQASEKFKAKTHEARDLIKKLDQRHQILAKKKLEIALAFEEKEKEGYSATSGNIAKQSGWSYLLPSFLVSTNPSAAQSVLVLLDAYKENIGRSISRIEATIKQIHRRGDLTIAEQLALSPDSKTAEELRERFHTINQPLIAASRAKLQSYTKEHLLTTYSRYVPLGSSLYKEMQLSISSKLKELEEYEKHYQPSGILNFFLGHTTPISELSPSEMKDYSKLLHNIQNTFEDDLNRTFFIDQLLNAQEKYETAKNKTALDHAKTLRKNGLFTDAYLFERKISSIAQEETRKWAGQVKQTSQLRELTSALKHYSQKINQAILEFNAQQTPPSYEEQIRIFLRYHNATTPDQRIERDIQELKRKIIAKIERDNESHVTHLEQLKEDIQDFFAKYKNISPKLKSGAIRAIDSELTKLSQQENTFETSSYRILQLLTHSKKTVFDMTPQEIVQAQPEKTTENSIAASLKKISTAFNHEPILTPHKSYLKALEKAEKTKAELLKKGQIIHASALNDEIHLVNEENKRLMRGQIETDEALQLLSSKLQDFAYNLKMAENLAVNKPDMSPEEQLILMPENSPFRAKLADHVVKDIQATLSTKKAAISQYINDTEKFIQILRFPKKRQSQIANELEACQKRLENAGSKLTVLNKGWLFNSPSEKALVELPLGGLVQVHANLKTAIASLEAVVDKYYLAPISSQLQYYENQLKAIQTLKSKWVAEGQQDSVDELDQLLATANKQFKDYFQVPHGNLQEEMQDLLQIIDQVTNRLITRTAEIKAAKPKSIGHLLQITPPNSPKYRLLCNQLRAQLQAKLMAHQTALGNYQKKINSISELVQKISGGSTRVPDPWKRMMEQNIGQKQKLLTDCSKGLPLVNNSWKPFNELNTKELLQYEQLVHRLVGQEDENAFASTSLLKQLEEKMQLEHIEKYLANFQTTIKSLENTANKPGIKKEKKDTLEAILGTHKALVFRAFNSLKSMHDSHSLYLTIYQAQACLLRANQEKDWYANMNVDLWTALYQKKNAEETVNKILTEGFSVTFKSNDQNLFGNLDQKLEFEPLNEVITEELSYLEEVQKKIRDAVGFGFSNDLFSPNDPDAIEMLRLADTQIEAMKAEIGQLRNRFKTKDGVVIEKGDIKTFDHLLDYKTALYTSIGKANDLYDLIKNDQSLFDISETTKKEKEAKKRQTLLLEQPPAFDVDIESIAVVPPAAERQADNVGGNGAPQQPIVHAPQGTASQGEITSQGTNQQGTYAIMPEKTSSGAQKVETTPSVAPKSKIALSEAEIASEQLQKAVEQMQAYHQSEKIGNLTRSQLNRLATTIENELKITFENDVKKFENDSNFLEAYKKFKKIWNKSELLNRLIEETPQAQKANETHLEEFLKDKEQGIYWNILSASYEKLKPSFDNQDKIKDCSLNQLLERVKGLSTAKAFQERFANIIQATSQILIASAQAKKVLNSGSSAYLSPTIVEGWLAWLKKSSLISRLEYVQKVESKIADFAEQCKKALENGAKINTEQAPIKQEMSLFLANAKTDIVEIDKELQESYLLTHISKLIKDLEISYPSPDGNRFSRKKEVAKLGFEDLEEYRDYVATTLTSITRDTGIKEGKDAAGRFKAKIANLSLEIGRLQIKRKFVEVRELEDILNEALREFKDLLAALKRSSDLISFSKTLNQVADMLTERVAKFLQKSAIAPEEPLRDQVQKMPRDSQEFKSATRAILTKMTQNSKDIQSRCNELIGAINSMALIEGSKKQLVEQLNQDLAFARGFPPSSFKVRRGMSLSKIEVEVEKLTKSEFLDFDEDAAASFKTVKERLDTIQKAMEVTDENNYDLKLQEVISALKSLKTLTPYPYFYIDKVEHYKKKFTDSITSLKTCSSLEGFLKTANACQQALKDLETALAAIKKETNDYKTSTTGPIGQLEAASKEPGILSLESKNSIFAKIEEFRTRNITSAEKALNDIETVTQTQQFPQLLMSKISALTTAKKNNLQKLKQDPFIDQLKQNELTGSLVSQLQNWGRALKEETTAVSRLDADLHLKAHSAQYKKYTSLLSQTTQSIGELKTRNDNDLAQSLEAAKDRADNDLAALLKKSAGNNATFDTFWAAFWTGFEEIYVHLDAAFLAAKAKSK